MKNKKLIVLATILTLVVLSIILTSRVTEKVITDHPMIGQTFTAGETVFYMEDCNTFPSCGDTPRMKEVNRSLVCGGLNNTVTDIYNNSYQLPDDSTFKLIELLEIESHGLQIGGGSNYVIAVLEDDKGLLSTTLFSFLGQTDRPFGFKNSSVCPL